MDLKIAGRRALVLGGNRGMGFAIAKALIPEGVQVTIAARDEGVLAQAAQALGAAWVSLICKTPTALRRYASQSARWIS